MAVKKPFLFSATYTVFLLVPFLDTLITMYKLDRVRIYFAKVFKKKNIQLGMFLMLWY